MSNQLSACSKCKAKNGWYEKRVHYGLQFFDSDGTPSHWVDGNSRGGKRKFCYECDKDITNKVDV